MALPELEAIVAVLLGDNTTLALDEAILLEADTVVTLTREGVTVTVVVITPEAVPEMVPSL